jgi:glutamate 5-kinase
MSERRAERLRSARRLVVKVGSSLVADAERRPDERFLRDFARQIMALRAEGKEVIVITSGATRVGLGRLGFPENTTDLPTRQAAAAVGQSDLIAAYRRIFAELDQPIGQILLTQADINDRRRYLHVRNTLSALLHDYRVVPIVNENDTVSVEGVRFGENDTLAALVAAKVDADVLILLSDVAGFFTADPRRDPDAQLIPEITDISHELEEQATGSGTLAGTGGMRTKLESARAAINLGLHAIIAQGDQPDVLLRIARGEPVGTLFIPRESKMQARKRWLGYAVKPRGQLVIDAGAKRALLERGSSLLPVGVKAVTGRFDPGDAVSVVDESGHEIARGLANYRSVDVAKILGCRTGDIETCLGYRTYDEIIHRDNLVVL